MIRAAFLLSVASVVFVQSLQQSSRPRIDSVENAGLLFTDNQVGVSGLDAGYSIPLGKQTLWLFGDVFLQDPTNPRRDYTGALSNCGLLVPSGSGTSPLGRYRFLTEAMTGLAREVIPPEPADGKEVRYWPYGGWHDERARKVYLFYARVKTTGNGPLAFRTEGFGVAAADSARPQSMTFRRLPGTSGSQIWWPMDRERAVFGSAVLADSDWLYVFGFQGSSARRPGKLARVRRDRITDLASYEYYAGGSPPRWSANPADSADVPGLRDFPSELSVSHNPYLGGFMAVHSVGIEGRIRLSLARNPWGPFEQIGEIGAPPRALSRGFTYAGKEHPELAKSRSRIIYITYVDSARYWLQLVRVTLGKG